MSNELLFHISESPSIQTFVPRVSPSSFDNITGNVVFAITERLLHNYLFPRDCPRVTFYIGPDTTAADKEKFFGQSSADFIVAIETKWLHAIQQAKLYCYELLSDTFVLLDECAGYYISYQEVSPIAIVPINDLFKELFKRNIEIRLLPELWSLADTVKQSSLNFSLIRMKNAIPKK